MYKEQKVTVHPSGFSTKIDKIIDQKKEIKYAPSFWAVTFTLKDDIDVSRGDFIVDFNKKIEMTDKFKADLIWMDIEPFMPGRTYLIKMECRMLKAKIFIKFKYSIDNFEKLMAKTLDLNDIANCDVIFEQKIFMKNMMIIRYWIIYSY